MNSKTHQSISNSLARCFLIFAISIWWFTRSETTLPPHNNTSIPGNIAISSNLISIPDRLIFIWTGTRDYVLRKCAMSSNIAMASNLN